MEKITKPFLKVVRKDIEEALKSVEEKHGITFDLKNITFQDTSFDLKIEANIVGADTRFVKDYKEFHKMYELPELGTDITLQGRHFKITGFNSKARKNCVLIEDGNGGRYSCSIKAVNPLSKFAE